MLGYFYYLIRIEVQAYHCIVALRMLWLLFNAQAIALLIKLSNSISFRITYTIAKNGCLVVLLSICHCLMQHLI